MRTTQTMRDLWQPSCADRPMAKVALGNDTVVTVAADAAPAFEALGQVLHAFDYLPEHDQTGGYVCRKITGGTRLSLHAFGIAVDVNWRRNPYGSQLVTDMPRPMVEAIEAIRTVNGERVFRWGGDWNDNDVQDDSPYDAMHFELQVSPAELAAGIDWSTVPGATPPVPAPTPAPNPQPPEVPVVAVTVNLPVLQIGAKGDAVRKLQERLREDCNQPVTIDGAFGPQTDAGVKAVQRFAGLSADGIVGPRTWGFLAATVLPVV